ncbi:hypothetical protein AAFC00_002392 [Neodothiora populina]
MLQSSQRRKVLDMVDELRKCGLDHDMSLPQIVVCGDQSAGKSSVLEALTEIDFPRADNTCTLFATEIILRRATSEKISVRILPDPQRPSIEQQRIKTFSRKISDFSQLTAELGTIIDDSKLCMGIGSNGEDSNEDSSTFARDVLRIEIQGPSRPQLTVVDLPGLIQNENRRGEKEMLDRLTMQYLEQSRTICLPVITATNDADNQRILTFVKDADPAGDRSLGIITKPDTLPAGSGSENAFIALANNEIKKYSFKLGWHVLKNRDHREREASFARRNKLEAEFFRQSNFQRLPADILGIGTLSNRLSSILFDHIRKELPSIRSEVESMLAAVKQRNEILGPSRASVIECRSYLFDVSMKIQEICRCALNGHYEHDFFKTREVLGFERNSRWAIRRLRALIQQMNEDFALHMRTSGHTLGIEENDVEVGASAVTFVSDQELQVIQEVSDEPIAISYSLAVIWAHKIISRSRSKELQGNYNPLVISELFWFQSRRWRSIAEDHILEVANACQDLIFDLLTQECPEDVAENIKDQYLEPALQKRQDEALALLGKIMRSYQDHPMNHNTVYAKIVDRRQNIRKETSLQDAIENATTERNLYDGNKWNMVKEVDTDHAKTKIAEHSMQSASSQQALDYMNAIYEVKLEVFVDIILTLVIEEHILLGLENIFSPKIVSCLTDDEVEKMAIEPATIRRERESCRVQREKLAGAQKIIKAVATATKK